MTGMGGHTAGMIIVSVPDPNQPQYRSLSVSRVILQAIHALD